MPVSPNDAGEIRLAARLTRLARVTTALVAAETEQAVTSLVVQELADAAGATASSLSLLVDENTLALVGHRGGKQGIADDWKTFPLTAHTPVSDCVRSGSILLLEGEEQITAGYPALEMAVTGQRSMACLPLKVGHRCVGAAALTFEGDRVFEPTELEFLLVLADTTAQALDRIRATTAASDRSAKIQFLADSSVELSGSLDYETTLAKVARLAVPWFADWCSIALDQDGELRTLAVAHVDPAKVELALEHDRRFPSDPEGGSGNYAVLRTGRSQLLPDITDEMMIAAVTDREQLELLLALNLRSAMTVPLKVHDRVLGVVTWVAGDGGRRFGIEDLAFGEDLAHRAALAIDNSRLHSQLNEVSTRLQRAVLPGELPAVPGWQTAACYLQAGHSDAGGDFYDVTPLADGRLAIFFGDVMGRGVTAAAAMAQMRAAIRAVVTVAPEPQALMEAMDRLFAHYEFHQLVTVVYGVLDPFLDELVLVNAGHPSPVVVRAGGSVDVVEGDPGVLLGAGGGDRTAVTVPFGVGDLLLGYTDGLVERRDEDLDVGTQRLVDGCREPIDAVGEEPTSKELLVWIEALVDRVRDARRDDDVAVLAVRRGGPHTT